MRPLALLAALALAGCLGAPPGPAPPATPGTWTWDLGPELDAGRTEATAAAAAGQLFVIGGLFPGNVPPQNTDPQGGLRVDVLDPASGQWRRGPDLPRALHHAPVVGVGDRVIVLGGYVGSPFVPLAETWVLDASEPPAQQAWARFVDLPQPRGAHAAATDGQRIWVFGGVSRALVPGVGGAAPQLVLEPSAWVLDTAAGSPAWEPIADFPDPRDHLAGAFASGRVFAVGGRDLTFATNTGRLDVYDPASDTWTEGPALPTPRGGLGAGVLAGRVVVVGGEGNDGTFEEAEALDPTTLNWTALPPMPEPRHGVGVATVGDTLYVAAGGPEPGFTYSTTLQRLRAG